MSRRCGNCQYLYTRYKGFGKCWQGRTNDPDKKGCRRYKLGVPYIPKLGKSHARLVTFDPSQPQSWIFYSSATQALVLYWTRDVTGKACWEVKLVGIKPTGGLHTKPYITEQPAFFGDVSALGAGQTSLWTSYGYEDPDEYDEDGVVKNKVRVLRLYPAEVRDLKGRTRRGKPRQ